ncbi:hypothetical protein EUZ85_06165 [Hahella sp. KA22]|uniref:CARDB domain-containing protein n=1 Tax=Hahella sp. KA22 TaxID=1628392 RepID=UPI000FDD58E5|nr:CARDB domain-containing protein [Hahella sp. KA22]AZZ90323.1 hypothetical protein ENC22_03610 [Hahella sp. KA22]QAY53694.1 hypothetical protein EUZ85_06165 [Hahella sp. KA22]
MTFLRCIAIALLFAISNAFADPIQDGVSNHYKAGWYPNVYGNEGPLTCPKTCRAWTGWRAEGELAPYDDIKRTYVCKSNNLDTFPSPTDRDVWLYGNQFDEKTACFMGTPHEKTVVSERYYCLCVSECSGPDLVIRTVYDPVWDSTIGESVIKIVVTNVGVAMSAATDARVYDPGTGASDIQPVVALAPGASASVKFRLGYWVFDPDAELHFMVDYSHKVGECDENNNTAIYKKQG